MADDDHLREGDGDSLKFTPGELRPALAYALREIAQHRGEATLTLPMAYARQIICGAAMLQLHVLDRGDHGVFPLPEPKPKH